MMPVAVHRPVLGWARRRSGRDHAVMRAKFRHWDRWIAGDAHPTFNQAHQFAEYTHVPFGVLFLPTPHVEDLPIPDFRV
jgi:glutathione S-transferase